MKDRYDVTYIQKMMMLACLFTCFVGGRYFEPFVMLEVGYRKLYPPNSQLHPSLTLLLRMNVEEQ